MNFPDKEIILPIVSRKNKLHKVLLYTVLFLSGVSALIYQVVWIRKFGLVFGVHVFSMSAVLTAFMAGLAFGSLIFGRLVDRKKNPLTIFYCLEIGIGIFAMLFPILFKGLTNIYSIISHSIWLSQYQVQLVRFLLAFVFLLIPTTMMGGTLPVIIKFFVRQLRELGFQVSNLYSLNNLGAVAGAFIAGFIIIKAFGIEATLYIGASLNILNAIITFFISRQTQFNTSVPGNENKNKTESSAGSGQINTALLPQFIIKLVLWIFAIEGFTTLAYEVVWTRILVGYSFDKTTYFFSTIIIGFIFGLSLGSFLVSRRVDKLKNLPGTLAMIEILIGFSSVLLLLLFSKIAPLMIQKRDIFGTWIANSGKEYFIFFLLLTIPTTLMGMAYPIVSKIYTDNIQKLGKRMGTIGFLDTVGSILGSFLGGFIMIPFLGVVRSFMLTALINVTIGMVLLLAHPLMKSIRKTIISAAVVIFAIFIYFKVPNTNYFSWWDQGRFKKSWWDQRYEKIVFYDESEAGTVIVRQNIDGESYSLAVNGHNTAHSTPKDLSVNRQLGYMPYIFHPGPKNAMVIGFGMGATACSLIQPGIKEVDVAEICSGVIKAAPVFGKWTRNVIEKPELHVFDEDGRSLLFMTDKKYDIITSNAIHPRLSNNIYTKDFYEICYDKLADDGIMCQWIPQNWLSEEEYKSLLKTFIEVFPHSTLWYVNEYSTHIIGSKKPIEISYSMIAQKFSNETLKTDLAEVGISDPEHFLAQYIFNEEALHEYCKDAMINTDNYPLVEFSKIISIAPVIKVMEDIKNCPTDYTVLLKDIGSEEKKAEVMENMNRCINFLRNNIQAIIENVNYYQNTEN